MFVQLHFFSWKIFRRCSLLMAYTVVHVDTARQYFLIILLNVLTIKAEKNIFLTRMNKQLLRWSQEFLCLSTWICKYPFIRSILVKYYRLDMMSSAFLNRPSGTSKLITTFAVIIHENKENNWILPHTVKLTLYEWMLALRL